jgi:methanogenic corrinoid protein MtbC1
LEDPARDREGRGPHAHEGNAMSPEILIERFFESLINGDRKAATRIVEECLEPGVLPQRLITELFWPTYELIEKLHRNDQLSMLCHHMATRLLRVLVDRAASLYEPAKPIGRRVLALCGPEEPEELGAQMGVDLLEAAGFEVTFAGGGVPTDEILGHVNEQKPDVLLMFSSAAGDLPDIRRMVDQIHEIHACPDLQIVVGGGVFNRAEGLAEEIGADLWASSPVELAHLMIERPYQRAADGQRTVGRKRKTRAKAA